MKSSQPLDVDLLYGILAVQLDFITPRQLSEAMSGLFGERVQPLGDLLVERELISANDQNLLAGLVQRHLALHGDSVSQSLQSLNADARLRHMLADLEDQELDARLSKFGLHDFGPERATTSFQLEEATPDNRRFRILRPHAKGGLGEVFVAMDGELHREVALKRIQDWHADDPQSRSRFLLEAEITGGLEHPGVVPVYGFGLDETGRPFYAMRFIRGNSLKDRIRHFFERMVGDDFSPSDRAVEFRRLLGRFVVVCQTVAYAHSRGVLHRDIKPANVMLGKYGETLVVDWGLAKVVNRKSEDILCDERSLRPGSSVSHSETVVGSAVGTPAFMSPEQAAGRVEELDSRSDVYSLGATLYVLLTGRAPFDRKDSNVLEKVGSGEFEPPELVRPSLAKPLASICKKAMQRKPEQRYESPRDLAEDIEHWLADEPVTAHPESLVERAGRVYRQQRTVVLAASLFLLLSTVGLLVSTSIISRKNIKLKEANETANTNFAKAESERGRAENNASQAGQLAMGLLNTAEKRLSKIPGQLVARNELTELAVKGFGELAEQDPDNVEFKMQLAEGLLAHANLLRTTNRADEAEPDYLTSIDLLSGLVDDVERGEIARDRLVGTLLYYVAYLQKNARLEAGLDQLKRANSVLQSISDKGSVNYRRTLARYQGRKGLVLFETGQTEAAAKMHQAAADTYRSLILSDNGIETDTNLFLGELQQHALALVELGQLEQALEAFKEAVKVAEEQISTDNARDNRHLRTLMLFGHGKLLLQMNPQDAAGTRDVQHAIEQWSVLSKQFPNYVRYKRYIAQARLVLADSLILKGETDAAVTHVNAAYDQLKTVIETYNSTPLLVWKVDLVDALSTRARLAAAHDDWTTAIADVNDAIAMQMKIVTANPASKVAEKRLGELEAQLRELARRQK